METARPKGHSGLGRNAALKGRSSTVTVTVTVAVAVTVAVGSAEQPGASV